MAATDGMCQVSIRTPDHEVDVTLSAHVPIAELMPAVVDLIGEHDFAGHDPQLRRVSGEVLAPIATLSQCAIADGELLTLTSAPIRQASIPRFDRTSAVADVVAGLTHQSSPAADGRAGSIVLCWVAALLLVLLLPGHPGIPGFLLAMSAASAISLLAWRLLDCAPLVFLPVAAAAIAAAAATVGAVIGWWPPTACGPMLTTAALAALMFSARMSVYSSGLSTADPSDIDLGSRARTAHRRLTAIIAAAAVAAGLGAVVTAATGAQTAVSAGFIAVVGAILLLQARRANDLYHVVTLAVSFGVAVTSMVLMCTIKAPQSTPWLCAGLLMVGIGSLWFRHGRRLRIPPAVRRAAAVLDLVAGTAVVPLAAAAAGVFTTLPGFGRP